MDNNDIAISVKGIEKTYKLYNRARDRLKDSFGLIKGPNKPYKVHYALKGVDMEIKRGETVGIIGTNGSGKSTLLKIITGVLNPTAGEVTVNGRISALLELGAGFNMEYNGIENIYLNGTMMGFTEEEIEKRLPEILEFADIGEYVYQPCKTYSSGMFVRLAFAVAINIDPEILIVDEALSVGDVFFQAKCYHKFEEFKNQGKTIVFVSHDLGSITKYCDRVYLLNKGELLGKGSPKKMIDDYKRVLVGLYDKNEDETAQENDINVNPELLEYGTGQANIKEYYVEDSNHVRTTTILKGSEFSIKMKVEILEDLPEPVFAYSFKNVRGVEITGTNTMIEKAYLKKAEAKSEVEVTFTQKMNLQGGEYLISLGCTGFEKDDFKVYHRLYDVINITVVSDKNTVGFYDMDSAIEIKETGKD
ncbi:MAG: ABC transporter ATP-binding protein [Lachnospiraceae bacterium]|nr:ABC transporter ATP-binding protein [Lachnospiraceae bacterium]